MTETTAVEDEPTPAERPMAAPGVDPAAPHECVFDVTEEDGTKTGACVQCGLPYEGKGWIQGQERPTEEAAEKPAEATAGNPSEPATEPSTAHGPGWRPTRRVLPVNLSAEERAERGQHLAERHEQLEMAKKAMAEEAKERREELKRIEADVKRLRNATLTSSETREVACTEVPDFERGIWKVFRQDTGNEVVSASRPMTPEEKLQQRQMPLDMEAPAPPDTFECDGCDEGEGKPVKHLVSEGLYVDAKGERFCKAMRDAAVEDGSWSDEAAAAANVEGEDELLATITPESAPGMLAALDAADAAEKERDAQALREADAAMEAAGTFICAMCDEDGRDPAESTFHVDEGMFLDAEARKICTFHHEQLQREIAEEKRASGHDFDADDPAPTAISSARAIDVPAEPVREETRDKKRGRRS